MGGARKSLCAFVVGWECRLDIATAAATMWALGCAARRLIYFMG